MKLNKINTPKDFSKEMNESIIDGFEECIKEEPIPEPEEPVFEKKTGVVVNCTSLYVRSAGHANTTPIDTINLNDSVDIIGENGDFWQIEKPEGFVMKKFIKVK